MREIPQHELRYRTDPNPRFVRNLALSCLTALAASGAVGAVSGENAVLRNTTIESEDTVESNYSPEDLRIISEITKGPEIEDEVIDVKATVGHDMTIANSMIAHDDRADIDRSEIQLKATSFSAAIIQESEPSGIYHPDTEYVLYKDADLTELYDTDVIIASPRATKD